MDNLEYARSVLKEIVAAANEAFPDEDVKYLEKSPGFYGRNDSIEQGHYFLAGLKEIWSKSGGWTSKPSGKYAIDVSGSRSRRSHTYKLRANGTYNTASIKEAILTAVAENKAHRQHKDQSGAATLLAVKAVQTVLGSNDTRVFWEEADMDWNLLHPDMVGSVLVEGGMIRVEDDCVPAVNIKIKAPVESMLPLLDLLKTAGWLQKEAPY